MDLKIQKKKLKIFFLILIPDITNFLFLQLSEMKTSVDGLEKERDFYFGKLRDIEVLCQEEGAAGTPLSDKVLAILYATEVGHLIFKSTLIEIVLTCMSVTLFNT